MPSTGPAGTMPHGCDSLDETCHIGALPDPHLFWASGPVLHVWHGLASPSVTALWYCKT